MTSRTKVVAFAHVSNVLGTVNPVSDIVAIVRKQSNAIVVVDGAQAAPHIPVDFTTLGADVYTFSGHKMLGPMGTGGVIATRALLESIPPYQFGGDMIEFVHDDSTTWNTLPHKFEAGTPNAADAYGLAAALNYLTSIGMNNVLQHERHLVAHAYDALSKIDGLTIYGPPPDRRSGVISFTLAGVHPHDLATILDSHGVAIRAGHHCAQPLMRRLGVTATARASFYVYNDHEDVDALVDAVRNAAKLFAE